MKADHLYGERPTAKFRYSTRDVVHYIGAADRMGSIRARHPGRRGTLDNSNASRGRYQVIGGFELSESSRGRSGVRRSEYRYLSDERPDVQDQGLFYTQTLKTATRSWSRYGGFLTSDSEVYETRRDTARGRVYAG